VRPASTASAFVGVGRWECVSTLNLFFQLPSAAPGRGPRALVPVSPVSSSRVRRRNRCRRPRRPGSRARSSCRWARA